ncbi:uncharacterized protein N7511_002077 [Penicillium nucicola]|uniref:uncharacterized protein n=1 Tax=Penicillium nucicola TaxID=1850975 RepID=UPI0025459905|nr:uncharacterized protein N7511_002077 [Penicillium nucicola]KAJ5770026.1 hypothetical protein N7511_002077 [Penicillium nucicola]
MPGFTYCGIYSRQEFTTASVWHEAQNMHSAIQAELTRTKINTKMESAQNRRGHKKADTKDSSKKTQGINLMLSNMGDFRDKKQLDSQQSQGWQTENIHQRNTGVEPSAHLSATLTIGGDGCLTVQLSLLDILFEEVWLDAVIATLGNIIRQLIYKSDAMRAARVSNALPWGGSMSRLVYLVRDLMLQ